MDLIDARYQELLKIIETKEFEKINRFIDIPIIRNTDLKDKLINFLLDDNYIKSELFLRVIINIMTDEELYFENELVTRAVLRGNIDVGIFPSPRMFLGIDSGIKDELVEYFKLKIKDGAYEIKKLPKKYSNDPNFVNYCLNNRNLSIINHIPFRQEYLEVAMSLLDENYGFNLTRNADFQYKEKLILPLIEKGYINSIVALSDAHFQLDYNLKKIIMSRVIERIKQGFKLDNNSLKFILGDSNLEMLDEGFIRLLLETNHLDCINYLNILSYPNILNLFMQKLKDGYKFKILIDTYKSNSGIPTNKLLEAIVSNNSDNLLEILEYINHHEELLSSYNENFYKSTRVMVAEVYKLNLQHLDEFSEKFGYKVLYYLGNRNIREAINATDDMFQKYMNLFSDGLTISDVTNIYDAIVQARFKELYKNDVERLMRIKSSFQEREVPVMELQVLAANMNDRIKKRLSNTNLKLNELELRLLETNPLQFLLNISSEIIEQKGNIDRNLSIIFEMNQEYLSMLREEHRDNYHNYEELSLDIKPKKKVLVESIINNISKSNDNVDFFINQLRIFRDKIQLFETDSMLNTLFELPSLEVLENSFPILKLDASDEQLIRDYFSFKRSHGKCCNTKIVKQINHQIKDLLEYLLFLEDYGIVELSSFESDDVQKEFYVLYNEMNMFSILQEVNFKELVDNIFSNDNLYDKLRNLLGKYKFPYWQDVFKKSLAKSNLSLENYDIAMLITKFKEIDEYTKIKELQGKKITLPEIIRYANVLASSSSRYQILLGKEDTKFIKLNPNPNAAINSKVDRLETAVCNLVTLYKKKFITTPTINENILINGKELNVNLGNFTNPINLTYGERTGSCMRIDGNGKSLYDFCQRNENSFHIRFTDSKTSEFVSRVSGFRNGNSIFLNELRCSVFDKYTDNDMIDAVKVVANMLIEKSRTSRVPIENVFITNAYAMLQDKDAKEVKIEGDIKEGLPYFYFDMTNTAIVLATTSKENEYVPLDTGKGNVESYRTLRDEVNYMEDSALIFDAINRFKLLKDIFVTGNYEQYKDSDLIESSDAEDILYLITGEDFVAFLDSNLQIHTDLFEINDFRTELELKNAVLVLEQKREEILGETNRKSPKV